MTIEALIKELTAMQKDLGEVKRGLSIATTRYNHLNYRVNQLKRKLGVELRKQQQQQVNTPKQIDTTQQTLNFEQ